MINKPKYIIIHCTAVSERFLWDQFRSVNQYHEGLTFPKSSLGYFVGYHVLITGGKEYKCKEDNEEGAHCNDIVDKVSMNFQSLGISIGFDGDIEMPSDIHCELLQKRIWQWQDTYDIPNSRVKFHRDYTPKKTCPGSLITLEWKKKILTRPMIIPPEIKVTPPIEPPVIQPKEKWYTILFKKILSLIK